MKKQITLENLDKRLRKIEKQLSEKSEVGKYKFDTIFEETKTGLFKARFDLLCNSQILKAGDYLRKNPWFGGINWYDNHIGRDIAGTWDKNKKELTIVGLY